MKIRIFLQQAGEFLQQAGIEEYQNDAWLLFEHSFQMNRTTYLMKMQDELECVSKFESKKKLFDELLKKRAEHIPLQHLIGVQNFMGIDFLVNEQVLIPRQDTEVLVEYALKKCEEVIAGRPMLLNYLHEEQPKEPEPIEILDMCTGSGCIAVSMKLLAKYPVEVTAVDLSEQALKLAKANMEKNQCEITLIKSDLFTDLADKKYDMILSNPPYIRTEDIDTLMDEVKLHEPLMALDGDEDGLKFYRAITKAAESHLKPNGYLIYEIGCEQGEDVSKLLEESGFSDIEVKKDLAGLDRVVAGRLLHSLKENV